MKALKKGDRIGVVSPSSFIENQKQIDKAIKYFESLGLKPVLGKHITDKWRYMGGTPENRAKDVMDFYKDKSIKAIFCTRGGAGSEYLLDLLDYECIKKNLKPLAGFSDTTFLQNAILTKSGGVNFSGFLMVYDFKKSGLDTLINHSLQDLLFGKKVSCRGGICINKGKAEGILVGGCLSVLSYLCGTKYFPDLKGKILILEDIGLKTYQLDLLLQQLKRQKNFNKLKGIIFGGFIDSIVIDPEDGSVEEVIDTFCKDLKMPILKNFPYSHSKSRIVVPLGAKVKLDAAKCLLEF